MKLLACLVLEPEALQDLADKFAGQWFALDPREREQVLPKELACCWEVELLAPRDL